MRDSAVWCSVWIVTSQLQQLADAGAGNQREFQERLEFRHPVTGLEQPTLLIR